MARVARKLLTRMKGGGGGRVWLPGYSYRKKITIAGTTVGAQTLYQMKLNVLKNDDYHLFQYGWEAIPLVYQGGGGDDPPYPRVIKIGSTYYMYHRHFPNAGVSYATAPAPLGPWTWQAVVLTLGAAGKWDCFQISDPFVILDGATYHMFYAGCSAAAGHWHIGHATSPDGITWTKTSVDAPFFSGTGVWDAYATGTPKVNKFDGTYYLFFHGTANASPNSPKIGYATCATIDGSYTEYGGNPVLDKSASGWDSYWVGDRSIIKYGATYVMFYEGNSALSEAGTQIGIATSADLNTWTKYSGNPIFTTGIWNYAACMMNLYVEGNDYYMYLTYIDAGTGTYTVGVEYTRIPDFLDRVVLNGHCQDDFDDIRFTKLDSLSPLDYWLESKTDGVVAGEWVEFDPIPISPGTANFYIYYGNGAAISGSDGAATFIVFDDFERGVNGDPVGGAWVGVGGSIIISTEQAYGGTRSGKWVAGGTHPTGYIPVTHSANIAIRTRLYKRAAAVNSPDFYHGDTVKRTNTYITNAQHIYYNNGGAHDTGILITADTWQLLEFKNYNWVAHTYEIYLNNGLVKANTPMEAVALNDLMGVFGNDGTAGHDFYLDNILARNWCSPEPTWGTWGSEEVP
jgi:hypothetical protein